MDEIVNRVANSGLITIDPADFYQRLPRYTLDISQWLVEGILLKEKDFRASVAEYDWSQYSNGALRVFCSTDAIIPQWTYMLLSSAAEAVNCKMAYGSSENLETLLFEQRLMEEDFSIYEDQRIILKGCGDYPIPPQAYISLVQYIQKYSKSIMYGEACSTVPVYKKPK